MVRKLFFALSISAILLISLLAQFNTIFWWLFIIAGPLIALGLYDITQTHSTIPRIFPVIGRLRYLFESIRPEIQQYFVESDINGIPVNREYRSLVYQRAKGARDTRPFGTVFDVYRQGYEWTNQSLSPQTMPTEMPRVIFGGKNCSKPYSAAFLNISAMSYGALSKHAIQALNSGAKLGGFYHNTGEGGISPYHIAGGGDLVWQIGTGYFACRNSDGNFDAQLFKEKATSPQIKMIEIKLSQGAKPGHGGILPASKLTEEIAQIRHVPMGQDVISPPAHSAFSNPVGLLKFVQQLRELSNGKPIGFKLCIGYKGEFLSICKAMLQTGIYPDFITVDGGEGGTGAAPVELTNSVGTPLRDGLSFVHNALTGIGVRDDIKLIASGKIFSAFHLLRVLALGADTVNSARGMMFALGCIQSRQCNANTCPTGIATQDPSRYKQLNIQNKAKRVANYHKHTIHSLLEIITSMGLKTPSDIMPCHIQRRIDSATIKTYSELYQWVQAKSLLQEETMPDNWKLNWALASADSWETCCSNSDEKSCFCNS
jgi:glutamate synthase domain-containing protein 2